MIDLSKDPFVFKKQTTAEICDQLAQELPSNSEVTVKDGKLPKIRIRNGLWRGTSLLIDNSSQHIRLVGISYEIPSFIATVIIYIASIVLFSIVLTVVLSVVIGKFVLVGGMLGIIPGVFLSLTIERIVIAKIKRSWEVELHQTIEKLKA